MSILKRFVKGVERRAGAAIKLAPSIAMASTGNIPGAIASAAGAIGGGGYTPPASSAAPMGLMPTAFPGGSIQPAMAVLPRVGSMAGRLTPYAAGRAAGRITASAMSWCRRNPAWCSSVGFAAVEAMVANGQLPQTKRRRRRGITATELRNFRRVAKFLQKYTPAVRRASSLPVMKKGRS